MYIITIIIKYINKLYQLESKRNCHSNSDFSNNVSI